jgi:hypothetical protein
MRINNPLGVPAVTVNVLPFAEIVPVPVAVWFRQVAAVKPVPVTVVEPLVIVTVVFPVMR